MHIRDTIDRLTKCIRITNGEDDRWLAFDAAAEIIEADRAAVALSVLDELHEHLATAYPQSGDWPRRFEALLRTVRAKYAAKGGG